MIPLNDLMNRVWPEGRNAINRLKSLPVPAEVRSGLLGPAVHADNDTRARRWTKAGIPQTAIELIIGDRLRDTEALRGARDLAALVLQGQTWGLICGGIGSGKSVAASWWLAHGVRSSRGTDYHFVVSEEIAALPPNTVYAEERLEPLVMASTLVIDDVGLNDGDDGYLHPNVQRVLRRRSESRLPTLCTTNLHPLREWSDYIGDNRIRDRWREIGEYRVTPEESLRGQPQPSYRR